MKPFLLLTISLFACLLLHAQKHTYTIISDSTKLTNCDSNELIIENHTQGIPGFLFNTGSGRTVFQRGAIKLNDSLYLIGADTLKIAPSNFWSLTGNAGTRDSVNFVGTTDFTPLNFRVNNTNAGRIDSANAVVELGYQAGNWINSGTQTVAIGHQALQNNQINGADNIGIGALALNGNTNGADNIAIGANALEIPQNASTNIAIGSYSLFAASDFSFGNVGIGYAALSQNQGYGNVSLGSFCASNVIGGNYDVAIGYNSLYNATGGSENTAIGNNTLATITSGDDNTVIGSQAMENSPIGGANIAIGFEAMWSSQGSGNTVVGNASGTSVDGNYNTFLGMQAGVYYTTGDNNVLIGHDCLGDQNVQFGNLSYNGANNVIIGSNIASVGQSLQNNVIIGSNLLFGDFGISNSIVIADGNGNRRLNVDPNGNVMFNTTTPLAHNTFIGSGYFTDTLTATTMPGADSSNRVASTAWVKKSFILTPTSFPDYVFDSTYELLPLPVLEKSIRELHHLPGIPSAEEARTKGIDMRTNQLTMLKKIEELTLYTIDQDKKIDQQEKQLREMSQQLAELKQQIGKKTTN